MSTLDGGDNNFMLDDHCTNTWLAAAFSLFIAYFSSRPSDFVRSSFLGMIESMGGRGTCGKMLRRERLLSTGDRYTAASEGH